MKKTELVFILDRSGSMAGLESDTVGGCNAMLSEHREKGDAWVTVILFSNASECVCDRVSIASAPGLDRDSYRVGGCTALLDAVGDAIKKISDIHRYARPEDVPEKTLFVITTDGLENASTRFDAPRIKRLIEQKKEQGWEFLFLGANMDAVQTAARYGIDESRAVTYRADPRGTRALFKSVGRAVECVMQGREVDECWKEEIEKD